MTDARGFRPVYLVSTGLLMLALALAAARWPTPAVLGGLALGWLLGIIPVASWQWASPRLLAGGGAARVVALLAVKLLFYGAVLYFMVQGGRVDAAAVGAGVTLVALALPGVFLFRPRAVTA
jgi:hypothetical protein